jgi:hypothetical protein
MRFGRRRSSLAPEIAQPEPETRRRNRLSKPHTGNGAKLQVSTSASAPSLQVLTRSSNTSTSDLGTESPLSPVSGTELRQQIRTQLLSPNPDNHEPILTKKNESTFSVAYLINQIEGKNTASTEPPKQLLQQAPPPAPSHLPQKRKSTILRRLSLQRSSSIIRSPSNDRLDSLNSELSITPPSRTLPVLEGAAESPSIPPTRRASFTPGAATRKPSQINSKQDVEEQEAIEEVDEPEPSVVESEYFEWVPPPPRNGRAGTPSDMGYSQLGGLRHGSLQIVNGRASPALSEASKLSKQLLMIPPPRRDASSEYGETDDDDGSDVATPIATVGNSLLPAERRFFSWERDDDKCAPQLQPLHAVIVPQKAAVITVQDRTSIMANEYIAEVGAGPFDQLTSDSPEPASPVSPVGTIRRTRSEGSLWKASSCGSLRNSVALRSDSNEFLSIHSAERSPSPTGSVLWKTSSETTRPRASLELATDLDVRPCESAMSWHSSVEPSFPGDEAFASAVEFQIPASPPKIVTAPPRAAEKSDSGYSSSTSLRSLQTRPAKLAPVITSEATIPISAESTPVSSRPSSFLGGRTSFFRSRKSSNNVATFASFPYSDSTPKPVKSMPPSSYPNAENSNSPRGRKKLVKKRRASSQPPDQNSPVQLQSPEEHHIPEVSAKARESLRRRSETAPELEQILTPAHVAEARPLYGNDNAAQSQVYGPSRGREQSVPETKARSRSRPTSWFRRSKTETSNTRPNTGISPADAISIINDFETEGAVLGRTHYDFVDQTPFRTPSGAFAAASHAWPINGMETAPSLSKRRSRSMHRDEEPYLERRPSFNDRGGLPGKKMRPASFVDDAPPITPAMLQKYRTTSGQRNPSGSVRAAPPPPPHSPQPSYLDVDDSELDAIAPPPPSHSPCPIDITPDPWAAQAEAWKAHRQSAGEVLKRQSFDSHKYEQYQSDTENGSDYPVISPNQAAYSIPSSDYPVISPRQAANYIPSSSTGQFSSSPVAYRGWHDYSSPTQHPYNPAYAALHSHPPHGTRHSRENSRTHETPYSPNPNFRDSSRHRPLASPRSSFNPGSASRPKSGSDSVRSFGSSMAEQIHPPRMERQHPPPAFGRYSGGMGFAYERSNGFGGSTGMRSTSSKTDATRKGVAVRAGYGVDLADVPVGIMSRA